MAEKLWRLDVQRQVENFVVNKNSDIKDDLDLRHSRSDIKFFSLNKVQYLQQDIFKYFYPFCLINCCLASALIFRQHSVVAAACSVVVTFEYVYFLFAFPVEQMYFHKTALSTNQPYAQFLRDSYCARFPDSDKARKYEQIDAKQA